MLYVSVLCPFLSAGEHPTTRMCLQALEALSGPQGRLQGASVMDYGAGAMTLGQWLCVAHVRWGGLGRGGGQHQGCVCLCGLWYATWNDVSANAHRPTRLVDKRGVYDKCGMRGRAEVSVGSGDVDGGTRAGWAGQKGRSTAPR